MIFPVLINGGLALLWGTMYLHTPLPYLLYCSGMASGAAIVLAVFAVMDKRYR